MGDRAVLDGPSALTGLRSVCHYELRRPRRLVAVGLEFDEGELLVEVDPDLDEVALSFGVGLTGPVPSHWPEATRRPVTDAAGYRDLRGLDSAWRWVLWNQQGYCDAFQIELGPAGATTTLQYLAVAGALECRRVVPGSPSGGFSGWLGR